MTQEPKWYELAVAELGTKEVPGSGSNSTIQQYYKDAGSGPMPDSVPWCAAFVGSMLERSGIKGTGKLTARSYLQWGERLPLPKLGAIVVFRRGSSPWQGHVAFFVKDNSDGTIRVIGGNQSDAVTQADYSKALVLGYRWPKEAPEKPEEPVLQLPIKKSIIVGERHMTSDSIGGVVRAVMAAFAGWAMSHGFSQEAWLAVTGGVVAIITVLWSLASNSLLAMVKTVAKSPEVTKVVLADPAAADAVPSSKVISE